MRNDLAAETRRTLLATDAYVTVGEVRSVSVFVGGEVERPGQYSLTSLSDVGTALAQAGGVLTQLSLGRDAQSKLFYLVKVDNVRFTKQVVPGDVLELHVEVKRMIRNMAVYYGEAKVDGEVVACAEVLCAGTRG